MPIKIQNRSHAWQDRPMNMDEDDLHPLTVARMTSHSVRGRQTLAEKAAERSLARILPKKRA